MVVLAPAAVPRRPAGDWSAGAAAVWSPARPSEEVLWAARLSWWPVRRWTMRWLRSWWTSSRGSTRTHAGSWRWPDSMTRLDAKLPRPPRNRLREECLLPGASHGVSRPEVSVDSAPAIKGNFLAVPTGSPRCGPPVLPPGCRFTRSGARGEVRSRLTGSDSCRQSYRRASDDRRSPGADRRTRRLGGRTPHRWSPRRCSVCRRS